MLTEEEKRTLVAEGYPVPNKLPLTKSEEKALKRVRRKIKNKVNTATFFFLCTQLDGRSDLIKKLRYLQNRGVSKLGQEIKKMLKQEYCYK